MYLYNLDTDNYKNLEQELKKLIGDKDDCD